MSDVLSIPLTVTSIYHTARDFTKSTGESSASALL